MATAPKKSRAAGQRPLRARGETHEPEPMEFVVSEDDGGGYRWRIVAGDGTTLAESASFASLDRAEHAARVVQEGAASASFHSRPGEGSPADLAARRERLSDELDAERWLDEGGSFSTETVLRWPTQR